MEIEVDPALAAALREAADRVGVTPEMAALAVLRWRLVSPDECPRADWEERLLSVPPPEPVRKYE